MGALEHVMWVRNIDIRTSVRSFVLTIYVFDNIYRLIREKSHVAQLYF